MFNFASGVVHAALTRPRGADGTVGSGKDSASPADGATFGAGQRSTFNWGCGFLTAPCGRSGKPSSLRYAAPKDSASPAGGRREQPSSVFQQVLAEGDRDRLGAVGGAELLEEGDDVVADRRRVDAD